MERQHNGNDNFTYKHSYHKQSVALINTLKIQWIKGELANPSLKPKILDYFQVKLIQNEWLTLFQTNENIQIVQMWCLITHWNLVKKYLIINADFNGG